MKPWWPSYVEISADVEPARWVSDSLQPWASGGLTLSSLLPPGFDTYARILHPTYWGRADVGTSSWERVARDRGRPLTAETSFSALWGEGVGSQQWNEAVPLEGTLPEEQGRVLTEVLERFTTASSACWFCVWEGWGDLAGGSVMYMVDPDEPNAPTLSQIRAWSESPSSGGGEFEEQTAHIGRVQIPGRNYFLFRGALSCATRSFGLEKSGPRPSMWWPHDHSWFVHTEIDAWSTYVAASRSCVDALLQDPRLEVLETSYTSRFAG